MKRIILLVAALAGLFLAPASLRAAGTNYYLGTGQPDPLVLLMPPPLPDSSEQVGDLAEVRYVHTHHTTNEEAAADAERKGASLVFFKPLIGDFFQLDQLPKTKAFFQHVIGDAARTVNLAKEHWKRKRPDVVDPSLDDGRPVKEFSYPSGHSAGGMTYALVLAEIFPDKRDALIAEGRDLGWHRVVIAKHYPTDVFAGCVLAQAVLTRLPRRARPLCPCLRSRPRNRAPARAAGRARHRSGVRGAVPAPREAPASVRRCPEGRRNPRRG